MPSAYPEPYDSLGIDLLDMSDPPPPRRGRALRLAARVALWTLVGFAALRGIVPLPVEPAGPGRNSEPAPGTAAIPQRSADHQRGGQPGAQPGGDQAAMALAAAFLREYLTIDADRQAWAARVGRYVAKGVDLRGGVSVPAGTGQYVDHVAPAALRAVPGGLEVTVLAHILEAQEGGYRDGGSLAFVVPMLTGPRGGAVSSRPWPAPLPIDGGSVAARQPPPARATGLVAAIARRAVTALLEGDERTLLVLGGRSPPRTRTLPDGWRALGISTVEVAGPDDAPTARVLVRAGTTGTTGATATAGTEARYLVPFHVRLQATGDRFAVRRIDAGAPP